MKKISIAAIAVAASFGVAGVANAADCKVGVSMYTLGAPYFAAQEAAVVDEAKKAGCEVFSADAQNDMNKQIGDIEDMVTKGVSVLVVNPRDPEGLVPAVNAATAAGVKVVIMDSGLNPAANFVTLVQSSNDQNGFLVGQWFAGASQGKDLKIALLSGDQGNVVGQARRLGVMKGLVEGQLVNDGRVSFEIVAQGWGGWSDGGGLKAMEDILTAHPEVNTVIGENDSMVLGAMKALEAAGRTDVMVLAAADAQKEALEAIKAGTYLATGLNDPDLVGRTCVKIGLEAAAGTLAADHPKLTYTDPAVITKDNVDEFYRADAVF
ncbi:MAG: substrate-binding domain-containing protein [bacterium]